MAHSEICLTVGAYSIPPQHLVSRWIEQKILGDRVKSTPARFNDHSANVGQIRELVLGDVDFVRSSHNIQNMISTENRSLQVDKLANEPKKWAPP